MNKNKKEILILIIIIFIGTNYAIYELFMVPRLNEVENVKKIYEQNQKKLVDAYKKKTTLNNLKKDNEQMKEKISQLDNLTVKSMDTPQLVYDFYTACKKYGIKGNSVNFVVDTSVQTNSNNVNSNNTQNNTNSNSNGSSSVNEGGDTNSQQSNDNSNENGGLTKLTITLKVEGNKDKVDKFLRNLSSITSFKLTVISINIQAIENQVPTVPFSNIKSDNIIDSNEMSAEIIFYQYILSDNSSVKNDKQYDFYNGNNGFDSISDMIK